MDSQASGSPALSVRGLGKRFGDRVAFEDVSFEVGHGEVFGFLGPNGAGKTTTVRTLGTLIAPTSGSATVAGIPLDAGERRGDPAPDRDHARVAGPVPAADRGREPGVLRRPLRGARPARAASSAALRAVNLTDRADDACGSLSKGLRQRVALARALLSDPEVLFLDEPTSGLDPVAARDVHELIDELRERGVTIFLTTHRLDGGRAAVRPGRDPEHDAAHDRPARRAARAAVRPDAHGPDGGPARRPGGVFAGLPGVEGWQPADAAAARPSTRWPSPTRRPPPRPSPARWSAAGADVLSIGESRHSLEDVYLELIDEDMEASRR